MNCPSISARISTSRGNAKTCLQEKVDRVKSSHCPLTLCVCARACGVYLCVCVCGVYVCVCGYVYVCVWCVFKQQPRSGAHDRPPLELTHSGILEPLTLPVKHTHTHMCAHALMASFTPKWTLGSQSMGELRLSQYGINLQLMGLADTNYCT